MDLRNKTGLLIDDIAEMRSAVRIQLADAGLEKCDSVRSIKEAIDKLSVNRYDLIVCDYNLGQGADGQQFLELVRRKRILPLTTAFLMITAEAGYEHVSTAAEFAPDDYLLKPFTSDTLHTRLARILDKKEALAPIYKHMGERGNTAAALAACDQLLANQPRYSLDIIRLKGDLLLAAGKAADAQALYDAVLERRATPWAEVGRARALLAAGNVEEARERLEKGLAAYPNYLAAYDSLAGLLEKTDKAAAQQVVEQALKVAPSTQRQRKVGTLALDNKDFARAEEAFRRTVEKDRTGFFKSHDDYAGLAKSCVEQGKATEALAAVKSMADHFPRTPTLAARQAAIESQVQAKAGNAAAAQAALEKAKAVMKDTDLDPATSLEIAQACFVGGHEDEAKQIIRSVAENHHENDAVLERAQSVFAATGRGDEGTIFIDATRKRMIKLNDDAVRLAKSGELEQAIAMLREAADRLPSNAQIALNAAASLLMHIQAKGMDAERLALAQRYIVQARRANIDHARLPEVEAFYAKIAASVQAAASSA